jgi:hypothetical protein
VKLKQIEERREVLGQNHSMAPFKIVGVKNKDVL